MKQNSIGCLIAFHGEPGGIDRECCNSKPIFL